jgi:predicted nucleic-acid-binding protein
MNTPQLKVELEETFRKALRVYEENNVKFADAVMGYWGLERGIATVFTYDEKDFKRIEGLTVKKPGSQAGGHRR